jgi:hypothetical protein
VAHTLILLVFAAIWSSPHAQAAATGAVAGRLSLSPDQPEPISKALQAMAARRRSTSSLPVATAFDQVLLPRSPAPPPKARPAAATNPPPAFVPRAGWGKDISWPQCDGPYPEGPHDIGVVGVTGGRPFTTNPCLSSQFGWAQASQMPGGAQVYVNLEIDGTSDGPHHCPLEDHPCRAYDYGYQSVTDAMGRAYQAGVSAAFWWLDVEVGNYWSDEHPDWNAATVQGGIDALRARGYEVGIYSSAEQWAQIVPDWFRPGVPTWLAVVGDPGMAPGLCAPEHSLTGGPVHLVQYDDHVFDSDHVCAAGAAAFAAAAARHR